MKGLTRIQTKRNKTSSFDKMNRIITKYNNQISLPLNQIWEDFTIPNQVSRCPTIHQLAINAIWRWAWKSINEKISSLSINNIINIPCDFVLLLRVLSLFNICMRRRTSSSPSIVKVVVVSIIVGIEPLSTSSFRKISGYLAKFFAPVALDFGQVSSIIVECWSWLLWLPFGRSSFSFPFLGIGYKCCRFRFFLPLNSSSGNEPGFFLSASAPEFIKWKEFLFATNTCNECLLRHRNSTKGHLHQLFISYDFSNGKKLISYLRDSHNVGCYKLWLGHLDVVELTLQRNNMYIENLSVKTAWELPPNVVHRQD